MNDTATSTAGSAGSRSRAAGVPREFVVLDDPRFAQCHASTVLPLPDGDVLAAWFGGSREGAGDVGVWLGRRTRDGWQRPVPLAAEENLPHWNPVLLAAPDGQIWLFYKVGTHIPRWHTRVMRSGDGGASWSPPEPLEPGDVGGRGPVKNKPILAHDGRWLAPASLEGDRWDAFVDISADGGRSWTASELVPLDLPESRDRGRGLIQPTLWEPEPGTVRMLARSSEGWVYTSTSYDGGRSWEPARPTSLPNNNSGLDATRLADGRIVCAHNPVGTNWGIRTPLVLSISEDEGASWVPSVVVVEHLTVDGGSVPDETGIQSSVLTELSYPAIVPYADGVALTYTWRRRGIAFAAVPGSALRGSGRADSGDDQAAQT
ncbi:sialidase family protein [Actinopolymorpha alba]|uniref:sialidase family protein n=1 Tax=Actinopolymorpha alba TaxID=533267 RepID=UPI000373372F|nr:sialidase family protein [Actinopolymorpha alba]